MRLNPFFTPKSFAYCRFGHEVSGRVRNHLTGMILKQLLNSILTVLFSALECSVLYSKDTAVSLKVLLSCFGKPLEISSHVSGEPISYDWQVVKEAWGEPTPGVTLCLKKQTHTHSQVAQGGDGTVSVFQSVYCLRVYLSSPANTPSCSFSHLISCIKNHTQRQTLNLFYLPTESHAAQGTWTHTQERDITLT